MARDKKEDRDKKINIYKMDVPIVSNIFGYAGLIIWSVQLLEQIRYNFVRKSTEGVSILCFSSWFIGGWIFCPYLIATKSALPLILQIAFFPGLILFIVAQHCFYDRKMKKRILCAIFFSIFGVAILLDYGIYELLVAYPEHDFQFGLTINIVSAFFMGVGFVPAVYEIVKTKTAEGLSRIFVAMDFTGGTCSVISLVFAPPFNWMAFASFAVVPLFEGTIFFLSFYYGTQVKVHDIEYGDEEGKFRASPLRYNRSISRSRRGTTKSRREMTTTDKTKSGASDGSIVIN
ncbi:hypothetical protein DFA_10763 [Cavenderia fasciculata]|uniref:Transmembrane protein n=1 Tax=Cavenderia fasciculata TaxID=261658 RepID=F4QBB8_CACFS|nr:uncharacterized protein DFA_10763 [Cavenderia fasciculata]EGG14890.1 hypothetical protein DFA_10763 [Cavenderia fasciculata]|eukprot:XP_004351406.1 hypothetical protein DFA_10763 [Cavenderia fasciculata]